MYVTSTTPLSTATPNSAMNPTDALRFRWRPRSQRAAIPPTRADGRFHVCREPTEVAPTNVALHDHVALPALVADHLRSFDRLDPRNLRQRHRPAGRGADQRLLHGLRCGAERSSEPYHDREASAPIDHLGRLHATHAGLYGLSNVSDVQAVTGDCRAVEIHLELHRSGTHPHGNILRPAY